MKRQTLNRLLVSFLLFLGTCGVAPSQPTREKLGPRTVADICEEPAGYPGQVVTLQGVFQGFSADECRFPASASPTITRSDWLIRTGADCLFVTGGIPAGLDPFNPDDLGRRMELEATVERKADGKIYLRYLGGKSLGPE